MDNSCNRSYFKTYFYILSFCSSYPPYYVHYPVSSEYFSANTILGNTFLQIICSVSFISSLSIQKQK